MKTFYTCNNKKGLTMEHLSQVTRRVSRHDLKRRWLGSLLGSVLFFIWAILTNLSFAFERMSMAYGTFKLSCTVRYTLVSENLYVSDYYQIVY
jgi:hypothetical protein